MPERRYVAAMFGRIAGRYDLMNTLMTASLDRRWRRLAASAAAPPPDGQALDVGTGTGKLAVELARGMPRGRVLGCDVSGPMLALARRALAGTACEARVHFQQADALALPFPEARFDCITSAFTVRNVADRVGFFREMARVARPGGRIVCLELSQPRLPLFASLFRLYFDRVVPLMGGIVAGDAEAYSYLPASVAAFLTPEELAETMRTAGLSDVSWRSLGLGTVSLHVALKREAV